MDSYEVERIVADAVDRVRGDLEHKIEELERALDRLQNALHDEAVARKQADSALDSYILSMPVGGQ